MVRQEHDNADYSSKLVSIIIPTKNSGQTLERLLESIRFQTYKNIETLVIDGFSSDNTLEIVSSFDAKIFQVEGERSKAKNFGIQKSNGNYLFFLDSDMILQAKVIEKCVKICQSDNDIVGVIIPERSIGKGFWVKVRDFERSFYSGSWIESARFFKKEPVIKVGGFDEDVVFFEESTLPQKIREINMKVDARITSSILHDEEGFDLRKWLRKKKYYSVSSDIYYKKYKKYAEKQTSIQYRTKILVTNGKWKKLIRHPILAIGLFILKFLEFFSFKRA